MKPPVLLAVVLAAAAAGAPRARKPSRPARLRAFAAALLKSGKDDEIDEASARLYQISPCRTKRRSYHARSTTDGFEHEADATLEKSPRTGKPRARELLLTAYEKSGREGVGYGFRLSLDGRPQRAFMMRGRMLDPTASAMDGQMLDPRVTDLDPAAPDVKARLEHELGFWLDGRYRKGAPAR